MILGINHVGLAVRSIDEIVSRLETLFGARELGRESYPELGQTSSIVQVGDSLLELMEPIGEAGVIPKFLAEHGQGLHHISLLSDDADRDRAKIAASGARVLGSLEGDLRVIFTHPKDSGGVIYEITDVPYPRTTEGS